MHIGEQIVKECWERSDGDYKFSAMRSPNGEWTEAPGLLSTKFVVGDHYFAPLTFTGPRRTNDNAPPRAALLWADLDSEFHMERMEDELPPTHLWETSPGSFQAVWFTDWADIDTILNLNKRLTYWINADRGGWFASKLLRVPGTYNWKRVQETAYGMFIPRGDYYHGSDLHIYRVEDLQEFFPHLETSTVSSTPVPQPDPEVWTRHAKLVGRLEQNGVTDRSKRLWQMAKWLHKQGVPPSDIHLLLSVQAYNKYDQRPEVLWDMVQKATV